MNSLENYYNEIRSDIAKEFGLESIGYGSNKLDISKAREYQIKFNALSVDEQNALIARRVR